MIVPAPPAMIANEDNLFLNPSTSKVFVVLAAAVISSELLNTSLTELNLLPSFLGKEY